MQVQVLCMYRSALCITRVPGERRDSAAGCSTSTDKCRFVQSSFVGYSCEGPRGNLHSYGAGCLREFPPWIP